MSAQPIETPVYIPRYPDPARRRRAGHHTIEDLLNLPADTPRVELSHGVMLVVPTPTAAHQNISRRLCNWLDDHAPPPLWSTQAVGLAVAVNHTLEPDALLLWADPDEDQHHFFTPDDAILVVEVVSAETRKRDRLAKPGEYAAAGIPYYWRIEQDPIHLYAYRLGPGRDYELIADSAELIELNEPFPIKLEVPSLGRRPRPDDPADAAQPESAPQPTEADDVEPAEESNEIEDH